MGNCTLKSTESEDQTVISISNFTQKSVIGKGGFGKVRLKKIIKEIRSGWWRTKSQKACML
ncbi:unnamed protein product [Paramecium octaurelia]|uniref:Uncharacterized protein n=1 Tax=Paramecium octaurelia TaxID=43137 RepID=A0A8S1SFV0_PAROT|nr:unnamed protein product [Paramecium octaurelia]